MSRRAKHLPEQGEDKPSPLLCYGAAWQASKGLIEKASQMGQQGCVHLLQENLRQEEAMAKKVEQISRQLGQQMAKSTQ